jgi:hypothetical protein
MQHTVHNALLRRLALSLTALVDRLRAHHARGLAALERRAFEAALTEFEAAVVEAHNLDEGFGLFVRGADGLSRYRDDAVGELYALSAFRSGLVYVEYLSEVRLDEETWGGDRFCWALQANPRVVISEMAKLAPTARTRRVFADARRRCMSHGGFATAAPPNRAQGPDTPEL